MDSDAPDAASADATSAVHRDRLTRLRRLLADRAAPAVILTRPEHVRYVAGWSGGSGPAVFVSTGPDAFLVAPDGSPDDVLCASLGIEVVGYVAYDPHRLVDPVAAAVEAAARLVRRLGLRGRVGCELDVLPAALARAVDAFEPIEVGDGVRRWRRVKDHLEQQAIRRSVAVLDQAFTHARSVIRPGASEADLYAAVASATTTAAGAPLRLDCNIGSGPRSALDDPHASGRTLERGDVVLLDMYPAVGGYFADLTRDLVVGTPSAEQLDTHGAIESALAAGARLLVPGVAARDIDRAVRDELRRRAPRIADSMGHHSGHGIGLSAWEEPWLGSGSDAILEAGMTVAIEPGLYMPGVQGMRLEGNYLVCADAPERLDAFPSELIGCPV